MASVGMSIDYFKLRQLPFSKVEKLTDIARKLKEAQDEKLKLT